MVSLIKRFWILLFKSVLVFTLLAEILVLGLRWFDPPTWSWRIHRAWFPPASYPEEIKYQWQPLSQIHQSMPLAVVAAEDQRFLSHYGVDFLAIWKAFKSNQEGGRVRGGSTITQQTAKNLWLWPSQSYWRKAVEAGFAALLELNLPKSRIIEIYLNIAEFGPGIFGVEAASLYYFNTPSSQLSVDQAASLAALLPSPYRYKLRPKSTFMTNRIAWISQQMQQIGPLDLTSE
ncbi:monofunctional biosynthetic peptidoglycan transglycosylase [Agarivorans litoreus]|uniref:monofunctional biosynthetic peptidoglycan transglycosylase n=1 Tax=Agarivorans litoreus TaxID=1510455 RepID=UPI002484C84C|nr:monofunctional biosynthetic peptidoglycan transglycosylase [Agarivorans litoreus]